MGIGENEFLNRSFQRDLFAPVEHHTGVVGKRNSSDE